jgi:excisionase family DNA binding protein
MSVRADGPALDAGNTDMVEPKLIGISPFMRRYGIGRSSTYELLAQGKLRAVKFGSKVLISVAEADALFDNLPAAKINHCRSRAAGQAAAAGKQRARLCLSWCAKQGIED